MTSKQFFKYLVEPEQLNDSSVVEMEQLIKQFPFFQTAHLLYLKALNRINPKLVAEKLPKESLFVSDRSILHSLLRPASNNAPSDKTAAPKASAAVSSPTPKPEDKKTEDKKVEDKNVEDKKPEDKNVEDKKAEDKKIEVEVKKAEDKKEETPKPEDKKPAPTADTDNVITTKTTTTVTETKTERKAPVIEVKETKTVKEKTDDKTKDKPAGVKKGLTNEERKQNHDNLVKDFFDLKDKERYETVASNVADDGTIVSAAADLAAKSQIDRGTVINEKSSAPQQTATTTTVVTTVVEKTTKPADEQPKVEKTTVTTVETTETPAPEAKTEETQTENQNEILNKIAALRKEREEANKKRLIAEEEAKKTKAAAEEEAKRIAEEAAAKAKAEAEAAEKAKAEKEAAEKAKAEAEAAAQAKAEAEAAAKKAAEDAAQTVTTTVTTTTVTETVTTTVETTDETPAEPATVKPAEAEASEPAKPAEEAKEMSAADKLLARLNKYKATEPAPEQKSGENLIDKFLREDHHLDRNKEVKEGDMGKDSVKQPELYSEKLAKLYIQQGHYDKAIASYEKLNAKYPDKAEYFAAQIEEIKKLMNNNK